MTYFPVVLRAGLLSTMLLAMTAHATTPTGDSIHFFGFADVQYAAYPANSARGGFDFGQVEIDLEAPIADEISFEAAIAFDPSEHAFGVGAFFIDFDIFGTEATHLESRSEGLNHQGIVVGQFDVPFGIDWQYYPSPERRLISAPLITDHMTEAWNDIGIQAYSVNDGWNIVGFIVNGMEYDAATVNAALPEGSMVSMNHALGGRVGVSPWWRLEVGSSATVQFNGDNKVDMTMVAADVQLQLEPVRLRAEYIHRQLDQAGGGLGQEGYYAQVEAGEHKWFALARYGAVRLDTRRDEELDRISVGAGRVLRTNVELRTEYQIMIDDAGENLGLVQLVVSF